MPRVGWLAYAQNSVLSQSLFLLPQLVLVDGGRLATCHDRAAILDGTLLCEALLGSDSGDEGVLVVVVLFPGDKVILVELLLGGSHVSVALEGVPAADLLVKLLAVEQHGLAALVGPLHVELLVLYLRALHLLLVVLLGRGRDLVLMVSVGMELIKQLIFVLVLEARLVVLGHGGALVS